MPKQNVSVKVTSAFVWDGKIVMPNSSVDLPETDAKSLLHRGKVELSSDPAPQEDKPKATAKSKAAKD